MKCLNDKCGVTDIESDDNFCYKCGHWTAKGYGFINDKEKNKVIYNGDVAKQNNRFSVLVGIVSIGILIFFVAFLIKGTDVYRSFYYIKRQIDSYVYGYNTAMIKTDNIYNGKNIESLEEAKDFIYMDLSNQSYKCSNNLETFRFEADLENEYDIVSVDLCDISYEETEKIVNVIEKMYKLFPNIKGALTNISIANALENSEYIAYFQPMFQFVNPSMDINDYNKVNKTQILLNSYYFLNKDIMSNNVSSVVGENWYVAGATWESTIAHELGHYITFKAFLKENNLDNIIFVTKDNESIINNALEKYDSRVFQNNILNMALSNYSQKYMTNINMDTFVKLISNYAGAKDKNGVFIADEAIAEAIHDYYLHETLASIASLEIVNVIKAKLV